MVDIALQAANRTDPEAARRNGLRCLHDAPYLEFAAWQEFVRAMCRRTLLEDNVRVSRGNDNIPVQDKGAAGEFTKQQIAVLRQNSLAGREAQQQGE